ncbi:MAG: sigma-70 family RNA polymerase sigma factor [Lentisphaerae bacterium]|nr:sigma-70 family RNA polymerase sigma factor [Lentisphaerota bacterium]
MTGKEIKARRLKNFEQVVSEYEAALLRYAARILQDYDAAQDVVQDAFIKLFKSWKEELTPSPQVSCWLYRVVHNCAVDYLRKIARKRILHLRHAAEQADTVPPDRGDAFRLSEAAERAVTALHALDLREQQLVILKIYEEKSYREISDITGLTVSNVGYILHHAMKKMSEHIKNTDAK